MQPQQFIAKWSDIQFGEKQASHDPLRWNFSDSTDLSEALLVATRRPETGDSDDHRTTFVNLWQNPDGVLGAHRVAQAVTSATPASIEEAGTALLDVDGRHVGELFSVPESSHQGRKWSGVQFARSDLVRSAVRFLETGEIWVPGQGKPPKSLCAAWTRLSKLDPTGAGWSMGLTEPIP